MDENSTTSKRRLAIISNSMRASMQACAQTCEFEHIMRRVPIMTALPLAMGTVFHAGTEAINSGKPWQPVIDAASLDVGLESTYDQAKLEGMLTCYEAMYAPRGDIEFLEHEKRIDAPVVNPLTGKKSRTWAFAGRMDALIRMLGKKWIFETKTTSSDISPGAPWWQRQFMQPQGKLYIAALRNGGGEHSDVAGIVYDVARKPDVKPLLATPIEKRKYNKDGSLSKRCRLQDESVAQYKSRVVQKIMDNPEAYFQRHILEVENTRDAEFNLWNVAKSISSSKKAGIFPKNSGHCFKWNRPCQYFDVCSGNASIDDPALFRDGKARY